MALKVGVQRSAEKLQIPKGQKEGHNVKTPPLLSVYITNLSLGERPFSQSTATTGNCSENEIFISEIKPLPPSHSLKVNSYYDFTGDLTLI